MLFVHTLRSYLKQGFSLDSASEKAIEDCINKHILEDFLVKHRGEVTNVVLSSFNQENHDRILKEAYEKIGIEKGIIQQTVSVVKNMLEKKMDIQAISELIGKPVNVISTIVDIIIKHPEINIDELSETIYEKMK